MLLAITTGGLAHAFTIGGYQQRDVRQYLLPYEQTAHLCQMEFLIAGVIAIQHFAEFCVVMMLFLVGL